MKGDPVTSFFEKRFAQSSAKSLLVTQFSYIRRPQPQTLQISALTLHGVAPAIVATDFNFASISDAV
jgi:hypothetical protein